MELEDIGICRILDSRWNDPKSVFQRVPPDDSLAEFSPDWDDYRTL